MCVRSFLYVMEADGQHKRKRGGHVGEDNSIDSDDYDTYMAELRYEQSKVDPKVRVRHCHDERVKLRADLWDTYFAPARVPPCHVEPWAQGIAARLDAIRVLGPRVKGGDMFQRVIGAAMGGTGPLTCTQMIELFEREFGIDFSSAIVPLSDEGHVLWVFNSNNLDDETVHHWALGVRTRLTPACKEAVLKELRDPDEAREHAKLCEVLPRIWLVPSEDTRRYMKEATFQATRCSMENALQFSAVARVTLTDYCFVPVSLCELHEVMIL